MAQALGSVHVPGLGPSSLLRSSSTLLQSGEKLSADHLPKALAKHSLRRPLKLAVVAEVGRNESCKELSKAATLLALASFMSIANPVEAVTAEDIAGTLSKVEEVSQQVTGTAGTAFGAALSFFEQFFTTVKPAVDAALPYVQKATDAAVQVAAPLASDVASQAEKALQSAGVDTRPVVEAAKTAVVVAGEAAEQTTRALEGAKPIASNTLESVLSAEPLILVGGAGALVLVYLLAPAVFSSIAYAARGYKGDLSAPQALDLLTKENYFLIDVRNEKEKSKSGVPSLPRNAKNKLIAIPVEELPAKIKSQVRNSRKLEAEVTAIKISYLKKISRGSKIVILDSFGDNSKTIAKYLTSLGFKNTWVVIDGFDGGKGWAQSRLGTDSYNTSIAEVLSPSRIIPAGTKKIFGTSSSEVVDVSPRIRLLPGGYDD